MAMTSWESSVGAMKLRASDTLGCPGPLPGRIAQRAAVRPSGWW